MWSGGGTQIAGDRERGWGRKVGFLTFCLWLYEINVEIINGTDYQEERWLPEYE